MNEQNSTQAFEAELEIDLTGTSEPPFVEQRQAPRQETASLSMRGSVEFRDKRESVRIDDLSLTGVGVTLAARIPLNEECKLTIQLSVCGSDYELTMQCRARHCDAIGRDGYQAGLQFIQMSDDTRDTLKLLIR